MMPPAFPNWRWVLRDACILIGLTALGGFAVGLAYGLEGGKTPPLWLIGISNLLMGTIGFTVCGCLVPVGRWRHLSAVAATVWAFSWVNVWLFGMPPSGLVFAIPVLVAMMLVGGGLSALLAPARATPPPLPPRGL